MVRTYVCVDIEADGPIPGDYSMVSLGAVVVEPSLDRTFAMQLRPISDKCVPEALAVTGHTREQTLTFPDPAEGMRAFAAWLKKLGGGQPVFVSDNNGETLSLSDARGNAEAMLHMFDKLGLQRA